MSEDGGADGAGPHPEAGGELAGHLGVAAQVLPQAALVHVELSAHRTRVVRTPPLSYRTGNRLYILVGAHVSNLHF